LEVWNVTTRERFRVRLGKGGDVLAGSRLLAARVASVERVAA
jgi:hypothetical protein